MRRQDRLWNSTRRVTNNLELGGDPLSKTLLRNWRVCEKKKKTQSFNLRSKWDQQHWCNTLGRFGSLCRMQSTRRWACHVRTSYYVPPRAQSSSGRLCTSTMSGAPDTSDFTPSTPAYGGWPADRIHIRHRSKIGWKKALDLGRKKNGEARAFSLTGKGLLQGIRGPVLSQVG